MGHACKEQQEAELTKVVVERRSAVNWAGCAWSHRQLFKNFYFVINLDPQDLQK